GILAKAVKACREWQADTTGGLIKPQKILLARGGLYAENDLVGEFLKEWCEFGEGGKFIAVHGGGYLGFKQWCLDRGIRKPPSSRWLRNDLKTKSRNKLSGVKPPLRELHHSPIWRGFRLGTTWREL